MKCQASSLWQVEYDSFVPVILRWRHLKENDKMKQLLRMMWFVSWAFCSELQYSSIPHKLRLYWFTTHRRLQQFFLMWIYICLGWKSSLSNWGTNVLHTLLVIKGNNCIRRNPQNSSPEEAAVVVEPRVSENGLTGYPGHMTEDLWWPMFGQARSSVTVSES